MKLYRGVILVLLCIGCTNQKATTASSTTKAEQKLGHVVLQVADLAISQEFYERTLNMKTKEEAMFEGEKRAFLAASPDSHHEIVLKGGLEKDSSKSQRHLLQVAFLVDSKESLQEYYRKLQKQNIQMELKDNQISWSIYFDDPDGNQIEVYWDAREESGRKLWKGEQETLTKEKLLSK